MKTAFPYGIPTGWFQVAFSDELAPGDVRALSYFGRELVLFRTEAGQAHLLDAFCPHLGAHRGHGGRVSGDRLVCPFHAWEFEGSGRCALVPYSAKGPPRVRSRPWELTERNGLLMAWFDRAGRRPLWDIPIVPECHDPSWTPPRRAEWRIDCCAETVAENQVDAAHFRFLHNSAIVPPIVAKGEGHIFRSRSTGVTATSEGTVAGAVEIDNWGLGFATSRFKGVVEALLLGCITPINDQSIHLRIGVMLRDFGALSAIVVESLVQSIDEMVQADRQIWETKTYVARPRLVDGDGPIGAFRSWTRQFYPGLFSTEKSP